jgi:hypothetical protein
VTEEDKWNFVGYAATTWQRQEVELENCLVNFAITKHDHKSSTLLAYDIANTHTHTHRTKSTAVLVEQKRDIFLAFRVFKKFAAPCSVGMHTSNIFVRFLLFRFFQICGLNRYHAKLTKQQKMKENVFVKLD